VVDFRYHLISIIAVLLALAIGIFAGSGFVGGPLLRDLQNRAKSLSHHNDDLETSLDASRREIASDQDFVAAVEPWLVGGSLRGRKVVLFDYEGTSDAVIGGLTKEIATAGGTVTSTIVLTNKFALANPADRDQLAAILSSSTGKAAALRSQAAAVLARAVSTVSSIQLEPVPHPAAVPRLTSLLDELERQKFVSVSPAISAQTVPGDASFLVVGGSPDPPAYDVAPFTRVLALGLTSRRSAAMVASPTDSIWALVAAIRQDPVSRDAIATVDNADASIGRIAAALGLAAAIGGNVEQLGVGDGADSIIPAPTGSP
jgi:hypothetical protein